MVNLPIKYTKVNNYGEPSNFKNLKGFLFSSFRESVLLGCNLVCLFMSHKLEDCAHTYTRHVSDGKELDNVLLSGAPLRNWVT